MKGNIREEEIDAIIYGVTDDFMWIKKDEIKNIILSKKIYILHLFILDH